MVALGCQAGFDIERDIAAAGTADLIAETATESAGDEAIASDADETDPGQDDPSDTDEDGTTDDGADFSVDEDGSFSFDFSSGGSAGEGGFIPSGPGSDPDREMSWNTDSASVLDHLASIAPPGRLTFEWKTVPISEDHSVTGPFPVGWEITDPFLGVTLDPGEAFDFFTDAKIDAGCQGSCSPQDWGAIMGDPELSPFARSSEVATVVLQDLAPVAGEVPQGRLLVSNDPDTAFTPVEITVTRWSDEASHFLWCTVSLDEGDVDLWPALADMCAAMRPDWMS